MYIIVIHKNGTPVQHPHLKADEAFEHIRKNEKRKVKYRITGQYIATRIAGRKA